MFRSKRDRSDRRNAIDGRMNRGTNTRMISYNAGMQRTDVPTTEKENNAVRGTVIVIGGFLFSLLLSRVRIHGLHMPLSLGLLLGSQLAGFEPAAIVGGIILGAFSEPQPCWQAVAASLLYWGITRAILLIRKTCQPEVRVLIFALCMLFTLPVCAVYGAAEMLYGLISLSVSVLSALCFRRVSATVRTMHRARVLTDAEQGMIVLAIGMLLMTVSDAAFSGWSLPVTLILLLTAVAVSIRGVFGAGAGTLWTVMLTLYAKSDPALIGSVALAAFSAAAMRKKGKPFIIGAFILSGVLFQSFLQQQAYLMSAPNLAGAMLLFIFLPRDWLTFLQNYTDPTLQLEKQFADAVRSAERRASREIERMGKLLGGFSGMFHTAPEYENFVECWTVQGALAICRGCEARRLCWKDADEMRNAVIALAEAGEQGICRTPVAPIDTGCRHFGDLCASVLLSYQQAQNRNAVSAQAQTQFAFAERQLAGAGAALCSYARRMRNRSRGTDLTKRRIRDRLTEAGYLLQSLDVYESENAEIISVRIRRPIGTQHAAVQKEIERACGYSLRCVRVAQSRTCVSFGFEKDAELHAAARISRTTKTGSVSGDATGECRIAGGKVCFALSDGMGSGKEARRESEAAIRLLFRLCYAGVRKELVYENVNRMLLAQNEAEIYATLDAVSIDLNTGEAELLKYGAPPSFLLRDGLVSVIAGEALPCGIIAEAKPSVIRVQLHRNDRIILCSDGVQDVLPEGVEKAIRQIGDAEANTGDALLKLAGSRGGSDDMTVMVIRVA